MKISTQALKFINEHYGSAGDPAANGVDDLVQKIGAQLGAVEEIINFGKRFDGVIIVKVVDVADHPNADRLHVCKVDDGGAVKDAQRDERGMVQVVCGAPNVRKGMWAAWLPPGSTVPSTYDTDDPFVLTARDFRGVLSNGMMASPKELSLGDSHEGILEITDHEDEHVTPLPGMPFAEAFHLKDDVVIDMENKMFTHRPDCFGWLGIAREIEGIYQRPYKSPEWYTQNPEIPGMEADELKLEVRNELPELVPRFTAIALRDVEVKPSPVWLQADLARAGLRSINNIVDYTNFFMLETGQPIHAYDYDKVKALSGGDHATIVVRHPQAGEKTALLNGKAIEPREDAIMIATDKQLIGVGGVMGGADTEVDDNTKHIIIEVASFDMYSIRRTSMAHGLFTDAVTRFNKGQSPLQNLAVLAKITDEVRKFAQGKVASPLTDLNSLPAEAMERGNIHASVTVTRQFINERLGFDLSADEMAQLLRNVECKVEVNGDNLTVTAPFWRTDIEIPEDVVEEIGRLYGYDHLPLTLPKRDLTPAPKDAMLSFKDRLRDILSRGGANELLTYNFVHGDLIDKAGQKRDLAFSLGNALSPDLQYLRMSLMPSLLEKIHPNIKSGHDEFALYEINKAHNKLHADDDEGGLPIEAMLLAGVVAVSDKKAEHKTGAAFYDARALLDYLAQQLGLRFAYQPLAEPLDFPVMNPFDQQRTAIVMLEGTDEVIGCTGEFRPAVRRALKLPVHTAGFELGVDDLLKAAANAGHQYRQLPRFPKVQQDICLRVPAATLYGAVYDVVRDFLEQQRPPHTAYILSPVDIYQREDDAEHKQITFRLQLASFERTLTDDEASKLLDRLAAAAAEHLKAERI
jgi:phenylalanyl-tRNA synthetase beta chain